LEPNPNPNPNPKLNNSTLTLARHYKVRKKYHAEGNFPDVYRKTTHTKTVPQLIEAQARPITLTLALNPKH